MKSAAFAIFAFKFQKFWQNLARTCVRLSVRFRNSARLIEHSTLYTILLPTIKVNVMIKVSKLELRQRRLFKIPVSEEVYFGLSCRGFGLDSVPSRCSGT